MTEPSDAISNSSRQVALGETEKALINAFQRGFPHTPRPFAAIGEALGLSEDAVLSLLEGLRARGAIDRVGPVFAPHRAGSSTLAAIAVPPARVGEVAALVSAKPEVNHNYEREHEFNLWFVVAAASEAEVARVLCEIETEAQLPVLDLPLIEAYHIDLGFALP